MGITDWIQSIGILLALVGLIISSIFNRKQLLAYKDQLKLSFFAEYTKRYQEIMLNIPESIYEPGFDYDQLPEDLKNKTLRYMRAYFDLCSEELDLWIAGHIEERVWNNWKEGIEYAFSQEAIRKAWNIISINTDYYPAFSTFIEESLINSEDTAKLSQ